MDVEVTIKGGKQRFSLLPYKLVEAIGLVALLYGLGASAWWIALLGAAVIVMTYKIYRRRHGDVAQTGQGSAGMADDNGGGDG